MAKPTAKEQRHMDRVAQMGCCVDYCDDPRVELHHISSGKKGKRSSHYQVIPLCFPHHRQHGAGISVHDDLPLWEEKHGTELSLLIQTIEELGIDTDE